MQDFRKLMVWKKSHELALQTYRATAGFPQGELYGLTSQIRRASASIPANIAEDSGRSGNAELGRFMQISSGSASELHYHIILSHDLGYLTADQYQSLECAVIEVKQMLNVLLRKVRSSAYTVNCPL